MIATQSDAFQESFAAFLSDQSATSPTWLNKVREAAWDRFLSEGIPTRRDEDWRFTPVASLAGRPYRNVQSLSLASEAVDGLLGQAKLDDDFYRLVFVNGHYIERGSSPHGLPAGVIVENLASSIREGREHVQQFLTEPVGKEQSAFTDLNTAFASDGAVIDIAAAVTLDRPIHLVFLSVEDGATACHPRNLIRLGKGSSATVIESYVGRDGDGYFTNAVTQVALAEDASLDHHKLQHEQRDSLHIASTHIDQKDRSDFRSHYFSFGAALARNELNCMLDGENIVSTLNGLYMPTGEQLMDCRTRIDHAKPNCNTYELYKGILDDRARGVFNGKIFVHQDAQKTDAKQSNQALLLSDDAIVNTKPQLEIYADDVKCTHGATIGELDEQALYYLRSRGIPAGLARKMLIFAFANDVVLGVQVPAVVQHLEAILLSSHGLPDV
ncbi:Fe-S cluster assembly protein SufD [Allorhodopirellula heiligendammensis]|uniref:FeS cluster assembly protein SufD n=1 Tax=Allorhodopirellula heiligendammensis TaxID=2714739 RepID=A0A5C6C9P6_9BACT|nr:Fe-S cluster assembly protein SufD [Allorhodopirellula heiligendammensis]TWU19489.1 FeS cluster assembly protein SufD [Allorhodopirellula heiligendammensis]